MTRLALAGMGALVCLFVSGPASAAFSTQYVVEDAAAGYIGQIPTSQTPVIVASDGESVFQPFGLGFDVSDAISLSELWAPDPAYAAAFGPDGWQQAPGTFIWYLAACLGGVCENGDVVEPIGKWDFLPGVGWSAGAENIQIADSNGAFSDFIGIANDGPNGGATVTFQSGGVAPVPEPATWAMMIVGFGAVGAATRRNRKRKLALA